MPPIADAVAFPIVADRLSNQLTDRVNVFTRQSGRWGQSITLSTEGSSWEKRGTITGKLNLVTGDASQACAGSEVRWQRQQAGRLLIYRFYTPHVLKRDQFLRSESVAFSPN